MRRNTHFTTANDHKHAQELRQSASPYEQKLWSALRENAAVAQLKFRRQQPIHPYIVDFACMAAKLIVELDGVSHDVRVEQDRLRDGYLMEQGFTILRFLNADLQVNMNGVVQTIISCALQLLTAQHPLTSKN